MAIVITNPMVEKEILTLATERGQSVDALVESAIRALRPIAKVPGARKPSVEEILQLIRNFPLGPVNDALSEDQILGYGPDGYPEQ